MIIRSIHTLFVAPAIYVLVAQRHAALVQAEAQEKPSIPELAGAAGQPQARLKRC
jgi:hypothetical protein